MNALMSDHITLLTERLITYTTGVWPIPTMFALMCYQITLKTGRLITYTIGVWLLPTMYALMYDQITIMIECFITYTTRVWQLPTMYALHLFRLLFSLNTLLQTPQEYGLPLLRMHRYIAIGWTVDGYNSAQI
jgi:hypothetical protein